jgi:taurine dioxygenase
MARAQEVIELENLLQCECHLLAPLWSAPFRHIETPELSMRFKWTPNSVAFWDNRCTQHHALWDYYPHRRYGHRVTVCGQKPY